MDAYRYVQGWRTMIFMKEIFETHLSNFIVEIKCGIIYLDKNEVNVSM